MPRNRTLPTNRSLPLNRSAEPSLAADSPFSPDVRLTSPGTSHPLGVLTDVHCHLLPATDDGPRTWSESLQMARIAVAEGVRVAIVTPHQRGAYAHIRGEQVRRRTSQLAELLNEHGIPLRVLPGADVRVESDLPDRLRSGEVLTLGDHGRHVLLELPNERFLPLQDLLTRLRADGIAGLLSHPERNRRLLRQRSLLRELVGNGCLLQITAASLLGGFGSETRQMSEWMLGEGLVHVVASDAHGCRWRRPLLRRGFERVAELVGVQGANVVFCENPAAIAEGREVTGQLPRRQPTRPLVSWRPWKRAG